MDLQEVGWRTWTGLTCIRVGIGGGTYERGNEHSDSTKCGAFRD